jgi:lipopolysaccharide/colanic/teichoic acid biosynthesis glycosyltransferase
MTKGKPEVLRRCFDVLVSSLALIALSPLLIAVALAISIESPGSPIYKALRVGQGGTKFSMWKFRTMVTGASRMGPAITGKNDKRITRLGAILRRTKIDELPQFVNILTGDMTLVGPRPEAPEIVEQYTLAQLPVLAARPGITGVVQLHSGEESESIPEGVDAGEFYVGHLLGQKIRADLDYLEKRTMFTDGQVLLSTVMYVLRASVRQPFRR